MAEDNFDPLTTRVSGTPIRDLRWIAARARTLLRGKVSRDVERAQYLIAEWREQLFEQELDIAIDAEVARLKHAMLYENDADAERFFEVECDRWGETIVAFRKHMEDELSSLPTIDDTSRLESLESGIDLFVPVDAGDLAEWEADCFLAAHALALIAEVERMLRRCKQPDEDDLHVDKLGSELHVLASKLLAVRGVGSDRYVSYSEKLTNEAFNLTIEALDAVSKAEKRLAARAAIKETRKLSGQVEDARREVAAETERRRASANSALYKRHEGTRQAQRDVLAHWDKNRTQFSSAERAGDHYADWLETRGVKMQQRTVRDWIRAHAKKEGVALR